MKQNESYGHRRSIRLGGFDYSQSRFYFVTICIKDNECLLGDVSDNRVVLSPMGEIAKREWVEIGNHFREVVIDEFIVMPNHIHGILELRDLDNREEGCDNDDLDPGEGVMNQARTWMNPASKRLREFNLMRDSRLVLGEVIRSYKARTARYIHQAGYFNFQWQRNYYEHIIRNRTDLKKIREYIIENPSKWHTEM